MLVLARVSTAGALRRAAPAMLSVAALMLSCAPPAPTPATGTAPPAALAPAPSPAGPASGASLVPSAAAGLVPSPAVAASPIAAAPTGPSTTLIVIDGNVAGDFSPVWAAYEGGYFTQNGLDVQLQYIGGGPQSLAALLAGQAQVDQVGGSETISAVAEGADLEVVAVLMPIFPYQFFVSPDIKTPDDLKGKKVDIVNFGGTVEIATRLAFPRIGLDPDTDVTFVQTGSHQNGTAALLSGAVQGRMDNPPASAQLVEGGFPVLFDMVQLALPAANTSVVMSRSYVSTHHEVVQEYVDALVQGIARMKRDEPFAVAVLKKYFSSDDDAAMRATYDFFVTEALPSQPFPRAEQLQSAKDILSERNPSISSVDINRILDPTFVQSAVDRGLAAPAS